MQASPALPDFLLRSDSSDKFGHVLLVKLPGEEKKSFILEKPGVKGLERVRCYNNIDKTLI